MSQEVLKPSPPPPSPESWESPIGRAIHSALLSVAQKKVPKISPDTRLLNDLGIDSLRENMLARKLEKAFEVTRLEPDQSWSTVRGVVLCVSAALSNARCRG